MIELQIIRKIPGNLLMLDILGYDLPVRLFSQAFINLDELGQILPAPGRGKAFSIYRCLHLIKILLPQFQVRNDCRVNPLPVCILLPHAEVLLHINLFQPVQRHHVKVPHRPVVFRRVSRSNNDPALRHLLIAESLSLEELQHGGCQRFRHTVDLVNKQNPLPDAGLLDLVIHGGYDLAHRIFCDGKCLSAIIFFPNKRKPHRTLSGMVSDRICHQADAAFLRDLVHDLRFTDSRRSHQKDRPLTNSRDPVRAELILSQICLYGILDLLLSPFNIHLSQLLYPLLPVVRIADLIDREYIICESSKNSKPDKMIDSTFYFLL